MKLPDLPVPQTSGIGTTGVTGVTLMVLHITGHLTGWAWPLLYVPLIISGIGQENRKNK
jgi:hypothetical protein